MPLPDPPLGRAPKVIVTRRLMPEVESRLVELFDATPNPSDREFSRDQLVEAMRSCDVLVPTVTDTIDAEMIRQAGPDLRLIANFGAGTDHIDVAAAAARRCGDGNDHRDSPPGAGRYCPGQAR